MKISIIKGFLPNIWFSLFVVSLLHPGSLRGGSTWDGGQTTGPNPRELWGRVKNWSGDVVPTNNADIVMQGILKTTNEVDSGVWQNMNSLTISNSAASFNIRGLELTNATGITSFHNLEVTISNNWVLSGANTWSSSSNTLNIVGNVNLQANTLTWDNTGGASGGVTNIIQGIISGTGGLTKTGGGTNVLTGVNTYSGATTINGGVLSSGAAGVIGDSSAVTVTSPGVLDLNGNAETIGSLAGSGSMTLGGATLTEGGDNSTTVFSGVVSGTGGFTKAGTGTTTLTGINTFVDTTTISGGTLALGANGALGGTTNIVINSGGTLLLNGGTGTLINNAAVINLNGGTLNANDKTETMGNLTLTADSVINLSAGGIAGILTFGNTAWTPGASTLTINNWTGSPGISGGDDRIFFGTSMGGSTLTGISFAGITGASGAYVLGSGEVVPAPEPGTILSALLWFGLLTGYWLRKRGAAKMKESSPIEMTWSHSGRKRKKGMILY